MNSTFGKHIIIELYGATYESLNDIQQLTSILEEAITLAGATLINKLQYKFSPQGVSMIFLLAESHLSIHTWPEQSYAAIDMYTCGKCDPYKAFEYIATKLHAKDSKYLILERGKIKEEQQLGSC